MLQSLFRRAEATVDNAIASMLARALVAIPFLVAAGFGTAALAIYAYDNLGVAAGNLLLAALFSVVGLVCVAFVAMRARSPSLAGSETEDGEPKAGAEEAGEKPLLDSIDRDVMTAMLTAVGPVAVPLVLRSVVRNLPLIAAVAAAGFVLSRDGAGHAKEGEASVQPAE